MTTRELRPHESVKPDHKFVFVGKSKTHPKTKWFWKHGMKRFFPDHASMASVFTLATVPDSIWDCFSTNEDFSDVDIEIVVS